MKTRFTERSGVRIAYQTLGEGELDIVLVPGMGSHVDLHWAEPGFARFMRSLARMGRFITFDKRGTGRSERVVGVPTLEDRSRDLAAVLDETGSERAVIIGLSEGAALASLFTATYPARVRGLVLCGAFATGFASGPYRGAVRPERLDHAIEVFSQWGKGRSLEVYAPSLVGNRLQRNFIALFERASASRMMMNGLLQALLEIDVRHIVPLVHVPAVMFHRKNEIAPVESARQMAALMPNCRLIELEGEEHVPFAGPGAPIILDEIERFIHEVRSERINRALGTVLFTDIVGSTERAVALGDRSWLDLLHRHDELIRKTLPRFGGREVETTGDGFLIRFDGPARAVRCAATITEEVRSLDLSVRGGIHTGELELRDGRTQGLAVHVGARVTSMARPDEVVVSAAVKDLSTGSGITFTPRETCELKGLPGTWDLFSVDKATALRDADAPAPEGWMDRLSASDRFQVWFARHWPAPARLLMRLSQGRG